MNTTISVSLPRQDAQRTRKLAMKRGFESVSAYLRFLLSEDDEIFITKEELIRVSKDADMLHKKGKLIQAKSLADFME